MYAWTPEATPPPSRATRRSVAMPTEAFTGILSILGQEPHDAVVLEAAAHLAPAGQSWRAVLPVPLPEHVPCPWGESPVRALAMDHLARRGEAEAHLQSLRRSMSRLHAKASCERVDCSERQLRETVLRTARGAGCVVTGVPREGGPMQPVAARWFADLLIQSGRPALVVPRGASLGAYPHRALVAWSDTPESARALREALRWLPQGCQLRVVTVAGAGQSRAVCESMAGASALVRHLENHHRSVRFDVLDAQGQAPEDVLIEEAHAMSAQVLVMGAYGHSRAAEHVFGGVTRALLHRSRAPLLLAH